MQLATFVLYDNENASPGTNTRLRWTFHPFGNLFIVSNHNVNAGRRRAESAMFRVRFQC
jgi:hypothetical protein